MNEGNNKRSLIHNLSFNDKKKLIWKGSIHALKEFVEDVLNLSGGKWSSPGGDVKLY